MRRATARPRVRSSTTPAASQVVAADEVETFDPTVARLRRVLELTAAGRTQVDIAATLNCTERTVRRLLKTARERELSSFRGRSPEALLADAETKAAVQYARWTGLWARARAAGNLKTEALILARMDASLLGRLALLTRIGIFDDLTFASGTSDEATRRVQKDRSDLDILVTLSAALNRGEAIETIEIDRSQIEGEPLDIDPLY